MNEIELLTVTNELLTKIYYLLFAWIVYNVIWKIRIVIKNMMRGRDE